MSIQTLHDTGSSYQVTSKYDGGVYAVATRDCVCGGVGDEFTLSNYSASSLDVLLEAGSEAVIGGSFFKITSDETITLAPNSTIYLCATVDLTRANGQRGVFTQRSSSNMQSDNLNGSGSVRDMLLYVITTNGTGVTNVSDRRVIVENGASISGYTLWTGTQAQYDAITTKDNDTLYFIKES